MRRLKTLRREKRGGGSGVTGLCADISTSRPLQRHVNR